MSANFTKLRLTVGHICWCLCRLGWRSPCVSLGCQLGSREPLARSCKLSHGGGKVWATTHGARGAGMVTLSSGGHKTQPSLTILTIQCWHTGPGEQGWWHCHQEDTRHNHPSTYWQYNGNVGIIVKPELSLYTLNSLDKSLCSPSTYFVYVCMYYLQYHRRMDKWYWH